MQSDSRFPQRIPMPYAWVVLAAAWLGLTFFPSLLYRTRGGYVELADARRKIGYTLTGARLRRPSRERTRTILPWMAQETQYCNFRYILGTVYSGNTEASEISPIERSPCQLTPPSYIRIQGHRLIAADSTILRMVNLFIALSFGVQREQLLQRMGLTWPRPFLLRPLGNCQLSINGIRSYST